MVVHGTLHSTTNAKMPVKNMATSLVFLPVKLHISRNYLGIVELFQPVAHQGHLVDHTAKPILFFLRLHYAF